jgi:tetratricopeptide (TPR) repeat protein
LEAGSPGAVNGTESERRRERWLAGSRMAEKQRRIDREERRENALRPSSYLGYDRDELGLYFNDRGAPQLAESQFRQAVWLNPYEPDFKVHLAECLFHRKEYVEAVQWTRQALAQKPDHHGAKLLLEWLEKRIAAESDEKRDISSGAR